jgi:hypothetical protein
MSSSEREPPPEPSAEPPVPTDHIAAFHMKDGSVVVYDERDHTAWVRSETAFDVGETR